MIITAGNLKGQKILTPDKNITRPTLSKVRMAVFNVLQSMIDFEGKTFVDMFAGSGVMGLEAYSRGFSNIISIENDKNAFSILKSNFNNLKIDAKLVLKNSLSYVKTLSGVDVVYVDPPYFSGVYEECLKILPKNQITILEHAVKIDFEEYEVLKQKKYGDKLITFLKY